MVASPKIIQFFQISQVPSKHKPPSKKYNGMGCVCMWGVEGGVCLAINNGWEKFILFDLIWLDIINFSFQQDVYLEMNIYDLQKLYIWTSFFCEKNICHIHFMPLFSYLLKTSDNQRFSDVIWEYRKRIRLKGSIVGLLYCKIKSNLHAPIQEALAQVPKTKTDAIMFCWLNIKTRFN